MRKTRNRPVLLVAMVAFVVIAALGSAYYFISGRDGQVESTTTSMTRFLMDTTVDVRVIGPNSERVTEKVFSEMERVENLFSRYVPTSEIAKINANSGEWVDVSDEVIHLVKQGIHFGDTTNGSFDISVGKLVSLWGFGTDAHRVPDQTEIETVLETVDYKRVEIDDRNNKVRIPADSILDLGGIAKGYAVDRGVKIIQDSKIKHALINAGGDISVVGRRQDENLWRVGVQDPRETTEIMLVIPLEDSSVVTSGDYQRYFMQNDVRFHHIIDPATGYPANGLTSVTIVAKTSAEGDALSTAVFVLGEDKGKELVERLPNVEAVIVDTDGEVWISSGLRDKVSL